MNRGQKRWTFNQWQSCWKIFLATCFLLFPLQNQNEIPGVIWLTTNRDRRCILSKFCQTVLAIPLKGGDVSRCMRCYPKLREERPVCDECFFSSSNKCCDRAVLSHCRLFESSTCVQLFSLTTACKDLKDTRRPRPNRFVSSRLMSSAVESVEFRQTAFLLVTLSSLLLSCCRLTAWLRLHTCTVRTVSFRL